MKIRRKAIEKANNKLSLHEWKKEIQKKNSENKSEKTKTPDETNANTKNGYTFSASFERSLWHGDWIRTK
jgi:hypothetical protein